MRRLLQPILTLMFVFSAVPMVLLLSTGNSSAQDCFITVEKVAPGAEGQEFQFNGEVQDGAVFAFAVTAGGSATGSASTLPAVITEVPVPGWRFGGIECLPGGGVAILEVLEDGWVEQCVNPNLESFCTVTNVRDTSAVPTLSEWGMIAAATGLMMVGVFFAVRRRRAQAV